MNFYRAMLSAADGCEVYVDPGQDENGEPLQPVATASFVGGSLEWNNGSPVVVTKAMVSARWLISTKWRRTSQDNTVVALQAGKRAETLRGEERAEVVLVGDQVVFSSDGEPVPMVVGREWRVLR